MKPQYVPTTLGQPVETVIADIRQVFGWDVRQGR